MRSGIIVLVDFAKSADTGIDEVLVFTNTEKRRCKLTARKVEIVISHKDTLLTGVGGMLMPRHHGPIDVKCSCTEECRAKGVDCVWAVGIMRSTNDPLDLKIRL